MNEIGDLANKFASRLSNYVCDHDGYAGKTENKKSIVVANIGVSIQDGELATISVDVGCVDSEHRIKINRYPKKNDNSEWRIEDK